MKPGKRSLATTGGGENLRITVGNYGERSAIYIRTHGGKGFIIRALEGKEGSLETDFPATEAQWAAWFSYLQSIGFRMGYILKTGLISVPAEWPEDFDQAAPTSDRFVTLPRRKPVGPIDRERVSALIKQVAAALEPPPSAHRARPRAESIAELQQRYAETPLPPLSEENAAMMGLRPVNNGH